MLCRCQLRTPFIVHYVMCLGKVEQQQQRRWPQQQLPTVIHSWKIQWKGFPFLLFASCFQWCIVCLSYDSLFWYGLFFLREINFMAKCKQIHFYETNENHNFFPWNFTTHGILFLLHTHISHEFDKWWAHHTESGTHKNDLTTVPNASFDTSQILKLRSLCMHIVHVIANIEDSYSLYNRQQLKLYRANAVPSRSEKEGGGSVWMKSYAKLFFLSRFIFHYANTWYFNTM